MLTSLRTHPLEAEAEAGTEAHFVGADVGGTKVRTLVTDDNGTVVQSSTEPTEHDVVGQLTRQIRALGAGRVRAVGVGVPGVVAPDTGVISRAPNVPGLDGLPLADELAAVLGLPVTVENDIVAAALAEQRLGGHAGETLAVIAAGTGIGLGIVHDGDVIRGDTGAAGEIADLPIGRSRVLEDTVSITGLLRSYRSLGGDKSCSARDVLNAAEAGERRAEQAVAEYASYLALGIRMVAAVLDPARTVLTGGIGSRPEVLAAVRGHLAPPLSERVVPSALGPDSPAHGAVVLALRAAGASAL
ncbi:ROK family protein [Streptomyces sp. NPDC057654]|uniref:ROK family protein n=1 Tax=Streptomyces sp. NPDC057654 TaxID=3346196 RepID=UPI00369103ED